MIKKSYLFCFYFLFILTIYFTNANDESTCSDEKMCSNKSDKNVEENHNEASKYTKGFNFNIF